MPIACAASDRAGPADRHRGRQRGLWAGCGDGVSLLRTRLALSFGRRWVHLIFVSAFAISLPIGRQAVAATINVPAGANLGALPSSDLANGNTLSLDGNVTLSGSLNVPTGSPGLTINGNNNAISLTNGDFALPMNTTPNFALQNVTIAGGNNASAISGSNDSGVNIPITGTVTFSNINTTSNGSAIGVTSNGTVSIGAGGSAVSFDNNAAASGGAISITNAGFALSDSATFSSNTATSGNGGAINSTGNSAFTINGPIVEFTGNTAASGGGAIFAQNNSVIINGNVDGSVTLSNNRALGGNGGAIDEASNSVSIGSAGSTVSITGNTATENGGAIFSQNNSIIVNGDVTLSNNHAMGGNGGALDEESNSVSIGSAGSTVVIAGNTATANGGAINSRNTGVTINGADITLQQNTAGGNGGAIDENNGPVLMGSAGSTVMITGNTATANGGAVFSQNSSITENGDVTLSNNHALGGNGGALDEEGNNVSIGSAGSTVIIAGNTATANGGAVHSRNTGVTVNGADITLQGNMAGANGGALFENNGPVLIGDANGATVNIIGNTAGSAAGSNGGAIYDNNGSVTANGNVTLMNNMAASGSGGAIYETNNAVLVSNNGGNVSVTGNTAGINGGAIYEGGGGAVMIGSSAATVGITTNTAGSTGGGIYSQTGPVTIAGSGITIQGNSAAAGNGGAVYAGNGFTLNANGLATVSNNAAGGLGGAVYLNSGNLTLNAIAGNISFSGNTESAGAANAIYFNNASSLSQAAFNTAAGQRISFFDPIASNGSNGIVSVAKTGPGTVSFDGAQRQNVSNIFARTTVQMGTFEVANGAVYGMNAPDTSFTVNSGAILQGGVTGTVAANQFMLQSGATLNIAGNAPAGAPFSTFTIDAHTAAFEQGSQILFNTELNDASVRHADLLVLSHAMADAPGGILVKNVGGLGGDTSNRDGIRLVQAINGATTTSNNFVLLNGELRAGAFDYDLFRGGLNPSNFPNDWFLRSSFVAPPIPPEPPIVPPVVPPIPPFPPDPPPDPLPPGVLFPIIGPELATYGVVQPLARQLGLSILGTLDDRVGDTYEPDGCAVQPAAALAAQTSAVDLPTKKSAAVPTRKGPALVPCPLFAPSVWGRFFGQTVHNQYSAFADPRASGNLGGFQGGIDLLRGPLIPGGHDRAGLYGAYGNVNADVSGLVTNPAATAYILTHTGSMNLDAWSAGGYWTHVGNGGWYLDAVLQGTWYYGSASTQFANLHTDGTGFIGSLEGGYPFAWPQLGPGFVIEPQGQILWQKVSFRHDYDGLGDVALGDTTGPSGRIGLRTKWTIVTPGGQVWEPYLRGNLWRDWGAEANTVFSGTDSVPLVNQATMLELGGGLTGRINANVSVFANVDYEFAVGSSDDKRNGVRGAFGARYTW